MGFWTDFRSFLRTRTEILDRLERVERETRTLRHDHDELDEFFHRVSRKRYQNDYVPPQEDNKQPTDEQLPLPSTVTVPSKAQMWERAKKVYGRIPPNSRGVNE